jgi:hypothetical protein
MTRDHHQPNDHAAWSTPSPGPAPWSSTTPATYSGRACGGLVSTCSVSCSPANRPASWRWTSAPCRPGGEEARSRCAGEAAVWAAVEPACEPGTANDHHPFASDPMRAGDQAARGPRRHVERAAPNGAARSPSHSRVQRGTDSAAAEPDTGGLSVRTPGWDRTRGHRTSARPIGRTSARRTEDADAASVAGVRTSWLPATTRWAAKLARVAASGPLGHPGRLRGDNACAATLTAAATEQPPNTAQHQAAPRRTALLRRTESRVGRRGGCYPVHETSGKLPMAAIAAAGV